MTDHLSSGLLLTLPQDILYVILTYCPLQDVLNCRITHPILQRTAERTLKEWVYRLTVRIPDLALPIKDAEKAFLLPYRTDPLYRRCATRLHITLEAWAPGLGPATVGKWLAKLVSLPERLLEVEIRLTTRHEWRIRQLLLVLGKPGNVLRSLRLSSLDLPYLLDVPLSESSPDSVVPSLLGTPQPTFPHLRHLTCIIPSVRCFLQIPQIAPNVETLSLLELGTPVQLSEEEMISFFRRIPHITSLSFHRSFSASMLVLALARAFPQPSALPSPPPPTLSTSASPSSSSPRIRSRLRKLGILRSYITYPVGQEQEMLEDEKIRARIAFTALLNSTIQLEELMYDGPIGKEASKILASAIAPTIQRLLLSQSRGLHLSSVPVWPQLSTLSLHRCDSIRFWDPAKETMEPPARFPRLSVLFMRGCTSDRYGPPPLDHVPFMQSVTMDITSLADLHGFLPPRGAASLVFLASRPVDLDDIVGICLASGLHNLQIQCADKHYIPLLRQAFTEGIKKRGTSLKALEIL
ncbi:hypothetical protein BJ684DRAFT_16026 [Piptocephalis cylindrospora]|uniref:F-box domain-containing protein n=1 Tax=Piptocephalis cylindrospora TaxID=1907219 RepID=A0A4P9Y5U6_9FUNG|nr:hypothetical protein BJ684DRAFT_16026 [Piptocephalis cylindrospora]|eukprot:RKP13591.1 hypothetical protein BJ684DRAFT_16026 [Piptocephalis cylindrospora]